MNSNKLKDVKSLNFYRKAKILKFNKLAIVYKINISTLLLLFE